MTTCRHATLFPLCHRIGSFVDGCCPGARLPNQWQSYLQFLSTNKLKTFTRFMEIMTGGENLVTMENNTHIVKPLVDSFHVLRFIHFKAVMTGSIWYQPWDIPPQHSSKSLIRFLLGKRICLDAGLFQNLSIKCCSISWDHVTDDFAILSELEMNS